VFERSQLRLLPLVLDGAGWCWMVPNGAEWCWVVLGCEVDL